MTRRGLGLLAAAFALASAGPARAQQPSPSPPPVGRISQDELDFQGRSSLAVGSGARALGMGGAFLARADDATAASWNPAGLSYLRRPEVSVVGARSTFDSTLLKNGELEDTDNVLGYTPDFLSVAYPFDIGSVSGAAQFSFQRVIPFRGKRTIERGPRIGRRRLPSETLRLESTAGFDVLALGSGVQVSRKLRLGGTVNRWFHGFRQTRERVERPTQQEVTFDLSGWNVNLGVIWTPVESLNLGAVGKTPFTGGVALTKKRTDFLDEGTTTNFFTSDDVTLDFPGALGAGFSWRPRSAMTVSGDYTRTFWSTARIHNFFTLPPEGEPKAPNDVFDTLPYPDLTATDEADTEQIRLGVEYVLIRGRVKLPFRLGYFSDRQSFRAADGDPPRFDGLTAGTGVLAGPVLLDFAYIYESGEYSAGESLRTHITIHRLFASLIYRHQGRP